MSRHALLPLAAATALLVGCNSTPVEPAAAGTPTSSAEQEYEVSTTVLESPDHGPRLCLGPMMLSLPGDCRGPDVHGWDWARVDGERTVQGTTSGAYHVVGTWDGDALTLTEPPGEYRSGGGGGRHRFPTPCPAPDGGWAVVDPGTATSQGYQAAVDHANEQPDFGHAWLDRDAELAGELPNGLDQAVLNVSFTGDLDRHERELRARYGGPLCVARTERSRAELRDLQMRLHEALPDDVLTTSAGIHGRVRVRVPVADQEVRDRVAAVDPDGLVDLESELRPVR